MESNPNNNNNVSRAERKKELRARIKAMQDARRGQNLATKSTQNMTKKEKKKMKNVTKSAQVDELLKQFNVNDTATKAALQKAIVDGRIGSMEDLAKFLSERTNSNVTTDNIMGNSSVTAENNNSMQSAQRAANLLSGGEEKPETKYEGPETSRPKMSAPGCSFTIEKEDMPKNVEIN